MAKRDTIPFQQEQVVRNFIGSAMFTGLTLPGTVMKQLVEMLGYRTAPNGALIWNNIDITYRFGEVLDNKWDDTFESDWERACAIADSKEDVAVAVALQAEEDSVAHADSTVDTSASEPTEGN